MRRALPYPRPLRALLTGSAFLFFWSGGVLLSWAVLPAVATTRDQRERKRRCQALVRLGFVVFHDYMRTLGLVHYDPRKIHLPLPEGPFVLIANHPTLVDVTAIMSACGRLSCVVKEEHFHGPLIGRLLRLCGHIDGGDGSLLAGGAVVHQALDRLAEGQPVLIFPEGTRSPERELHRFQRGAFEIARRAGVPLVPLLLTCNPPTLMRGQPWYEVPHKRAVLTVEPLEPMGSEELAGSSKTLAKRIQQRYQSQLDAFWERVDTPATSAEKPGRGR